MCQNERKLVHINDKWYSEVNKILINKTTPIKFIGYCCKIKKNITHFRLNNPTALSQHLRYGGYLNLPQLHVLIFSQLGNIVDIH